MTTDLQLRFTNSQHLLLSLTSTQSYVRDCSHSFVTEHKVFPNSLLHLDSMVLNFSDIVALLQELRNSVSACYARADIADDNKDTLDRLLRDYNDAIEDAQYVNNFQELSPFTMRSLKRCEDNLKKNLDKLTALETDVQEASFRNRVRRMKDVLQCCQEDITQFRSFLREEVMPSLAEEAHSAPADTFTQATNVPTNPPRLILDYSTTNTAEGQLKAAVQDDTRGRIVSVIAVGQGGVGKACALRGLAEGVDINGRFGSILYIQLNENASVSTIVSGIAKVVERTGGKRLSRTLHGIEYLQDVADAAAEWFQNQSCLFLVDDVWCSNDIDPNSFAALFTLVNEFSRMVYTTRDRRLPGHTENIIRFEVKESRGVLARRMLLKHADFIEGQLDVESERAVHGILDICAGLPLTIGVAGALIRKRAEMCAPDQRWHAWTHVCEEISSDRSRLMVDKSLSMYGPLVSVVDSALRALVKTLSNIHELFQAFCTLPKQTQIPEQALQRLWAIDSAETRSIMEQLHDLPLLQISIGENAWSIRIHDLILDIATQQAQERGEEQKHFRNLLHGYATKQRRAWESTNQPAERIRLFAAPPKRNGSTIAVVSKWVRCCCFVENVQASASHEHDATAQECTLRQAW